MTFKIESYRRTDGELVRTMEYDLLEYTRWIGQALERGYKYENTGYGRMMVYGGRGTRDFLVGVAD